MSNPPPGRLQEKFAGSDFSDHGRKWDELWEEQFTPWDRGGPSLALADVLEERDDLIPAATAQKYALVPGCGKGHDVLLLAASGYDVYGLDYSAAATKTAMENQQAVGSDEVYQPREGIRKGTINWVTGDFFGDDWIDKSVNNGKFDLIFDYTFLCAFPLSARPSWAKRMAELLSPDGRLICLEFPSYKPLSMPGPPWGVQPETYLALLSHPGEEISYDEAGTVLYDKMDLPPDRGLKRLELIKPRRTHEAGIDEDGKITDSVSVWAHV